MNDERSAKGNTMTTGDAGSPATAEKPPELKLRTKEFALRILRLYASLPKTTEAQVLGKQVLRSGTSVGAQYREVRRARSSPEFISKIECSLQELEETVYWLELLTEAGIVRASRLRELLQEAEELTSIFVSSVKTVKRTSNVRETMKYER